MTNQVTFYYLDISVIGPVTGGVPYPIISFCPETHSTHIRMIAFMARWSVLGFGGMVSGCGWGWKTEAPN